MELSRVAHGFVSDHALVLEGIDKRFGAVQALSGASLSVRRGTLHAVLGENGAGKTTLMHIAFGMLPADAGRMILDGQSVDVVSEARGIAPTIGMVHQHFTLVPTLTVCENIALGGHGTLNHRAVNVRVAALSAQTGLAVDARVRVSALGVGAQQRVEILKALYGNARVLILDEPSAVLTPREADELFAWLRRWVATGGTVVLVTHKLREALSYADDITVLRRGATVLHSPTRDVDAATIVRALTGEKSDAPQEMAQPSVRARDPDVVAQLHKASVRNRRGVVRLHHTDLSLRAGELVGVAGVEGSGVHEFIRVMAGRLAPTEGSAVLPETIGFVPEDRLSDALIEEFTLAENLALRGAGTRRGRLDWQALRQQTAKVMARHDVRAVGSEARASWLSGGNQQKFVLGRELEPRPSLLVAENPVRGLDIRATAHVLRELCDAAAHGSAVVLYSTDIDDVLPVAQRMLVVFAGTVREVPVDRDAVAAALVGAP